MKIEFIKKSEVPDITRRGRRDDDWDRLVKPFLESSHSDREAMKFDFEGNVNKAKHYVPYLQSQAKKNKVAVIVTQRKDLVFLKKDEGVKEVE
jgi:uncharacterized protein YifN (PemK superfamily)